MSARQQTITNLEEVNKELKLKLSTLETKSTVNIEQMMKNQTEERNSFMEKIDNLKADLTQREKTIYTLTQQSENMEKQILDLSGKVEKYRSGQDRELADFREKHESLSQQHAELSDSYVKLKLNFDKEIALKD